MKSKSNLKFLTTILWLTLLFVVNNSYSQDPGGGGAGAGSCGPTGSQTLPDDDDNDGDDWDVVILVSFDPNEIIGPEGFDTVHWVSIKDNMGYTINFENDPKMATAPAKNVYLYYPVSPKQDMTTFRLGSFGFNKSIFNVPVNASFYSMRLDLRNSLNLYVDVTAGMDVVNRRAFWIFESIDPVTGLSPTDALVGLLPVKDSTITLLSDTVPVDGEGFVNFSIKPKTNSHTRDSILATAKIVFDTNDTIPTNVERNIIDALPPTSTLTADPIVNNNSVTIHFSAQDDNNGCGVKNYDLYVAQDSANYNTYLTNVTDTVIHFTGVEGSVYHFFSLASDNVGNREAMKGIPDISVDFKKDIVVQVSAFIEGYYIGSGTMQAVIDRNNYPNLCDTLILQLASATPPHNILYADTSILQTNGLAVFHFNSTTIEGSYYLILRHRNSIETWNAMPLPLQLGNNTYNFTTAQSQAYGNNMKDVFSENIWSIYTGDLNQDGFIDIFDFPLYDADNQNFVNGVYAVTDMNGDGFVDIFDFPIFDANNQNFVMAMRP